MATVAAKVLLILLPIGLGIALRALRVFDARDAEALRAFVIRLALPLLIFFSAFDSPRGDLVLLPLMAAAAVLVTLGRFVLAWPVTLAGRGRRIRTAMHVSAALGNYGWLGLGVVQAATGEAGLRRAVFFIMAWWPIFFASGFAAAGLHQDGARRPADYRHALRLAAPAFGALGLGIAANLLRVPVPGLLQDALRPMAATAIPLILFSSGLSLNLAGWRGAWAPALAVSAVALLGGPLAGWLVSVLLPVDALSRTVIILESAMPVAVMSPLLADYIDMDRDVSESAVVLSTLAAMATLPLLLALLGG